MWDELKRKLLSAALAGKDWLDEGASVGTRLRSLDAQNSGGNVALPTPDEILENEGTQTAAGFLGSIGGAKNLIKDWRWRPPAAVRRDIGLTEVPGYIQNVYGNFMREQAARAAGGGLGAEDLLKAFAITRGSVNRAARGGVRPEGAVAEWLTTPAGRDYLAAAAKGSIDTKAIGNLVEQFQPFGMADTLGKDLAFGAEKLGAKGEGLSSAVTGSREGWREFSQDIPGIGPAKSGFLASLLGRGDMPTLDARQLNLHAPGSTAQEVSKFFRRGGGEGGNQAVDRLAARQREMALALDPSLAPHYQHLTHHAVWDRLGRTQTIHDDLVRAMLNE